MYAIFGEVITVSIIFMLVSSKPEYLVVDYVLFFDPIAIKPNAFIEVLIKGVIGRYSWLRQFDSVYGCPGTQHIHCGIVFQDTVSVGI